MEGQELSTVAYQEMQSNDEGAREILGNSVFCNVEDKRGFIDAVIKFEGDNVGLLEYLKKEERPFIEYLFARRGYVIGDKGDETKFRNSLKDSIPPIRKRYKSKLAVLTGLQKEHREGIRVGINVLDYYRAMAYECMQRIEKIKEIGKKLPDIYPERRILDEMRVLSDILWKIYTIEKENTGMLEGGAVINNYGNMQLNRNDVVIEGQTKKIMTDIFKKLGIGEDEIKKQYDLLEQSQNLVADDIVEGILD